MKQTSGSGGALGFVADGFLDFLRRAAIFGDEILERVAGLETLEHVRGGNAGIRNHRVSEGPAQVQVSSAATGGGELSLHRDPGAPAVRLGDIPAVAGGKRRPSPSKTPESRTTHIGIGIAYKPEVRSDPAGRNPPAN